MTASGLIEAEDKMKTAVMTDTNSGITKELAQKLGLYLLPMPVILDGKTYYEGETISEDAFYRALLSGAAASTSQPSPGDVLGLWEKALAEGWEQVVYIPMSSGLSQSCACAAALTEDYGGRVQVVDNRRISATLKHSALQAVRLSAQGADAAEIKAVLEREAYNASIYITVDTLEYLKRGGRVTPAAAMLGTVLNIKPILAIQGGKLDAFAKARGRKHCTELMLQALREDVERRFQGLDLSGLRVYAAGTALAPEEVEETKAALRAAFPGREVEYDPLSISIGCHTGPGAVGMAVCL